MYSELIIFIEHRRTKAHYFSAMKLFYVIVSLCICFLCACGDKSSSAKNSSPSMTTNQKTSPGSSFKIIDYPTGAAERAKILAMSFTYTPTDSGLTAVPVINTKTTTYYDHLAPKATVLGDYNQLPFRCYLAVNLSWAFEKNLPHDILQELHKRNLLNKKIVDIFIVVQPLAFLGGNSDGSIANITYLKAHGWADPDAILPFHGDRVRREFLYGIYDADVDISHQVKLNTLKPFMVHTHDGMYSPQTAALNLTKPDLPSTWFYSVVVDEKNHKAIVVLHILIEAAKDGDFQDAVLERKSDGTIGAKGKNFLDYVQDLKTSGFKGEKFITAIEGLIKN